MDATTRKTCCICKRLVRTDNLGRHLRTFHRGSDLWAKCVGGAAWVSPEAVMEKQKEVSRYRHCPDCGIAVRNVRRHLSRQHGKRIVSVRKPPEEDGGEFREWLMGVEGGEHKETVAADKVRQAASLTGIFSPRYDMSDTTVTEGLSRICKKFIEKNPNSYQASTMKLYLISYQAYCRWLRCKALISESQLRTVETRIRLWCGALNRRIQKRTAEKQISDKNRLLTGGEVAAYLNGGGREKAIRLKREWIAGDKVTRDVHTAVRNFCIVCVTIASACRPGVVANMRLEDVEAAKRAVYEDKHILRVLAHKTTASQGGAKIPLDRADFSMLEFYRDELRPRDTGTDIFFLTWNGSPITSVLIPRILTEALRGKDPKAATVTSTVIRKTAVTKMLDKNPGQDSVLAKMMCHSVRTQKTVYDTDKSDKSIVAISQDMLACIRE